MVFSFFSAFVLGAGLVTWIISLVIGWTASSLIDENSDGLWILRFTYTILGYATVFIPCFVLVHLAKKHSLHTLGINVFFLNHASVNYQSFKLTGGCQWKLLKLILTGNTLDIPLDGDVKFEPLQQKSDKNEASSVWQNAKSLFLCCAGLQVSYLTWGILQEKIMTRSVWSF